MKKLNRNDVHLALDLKITRDFTNNPNVVGGWQYTDAAVLKLWNLKDQIGSQDLIEYLTGRIEGARRRTEESKARQAVKEAAKKAAEDAQAKRDAEKRQSVEDDIRNRVQASNPGIKPDELNRVVARMLEDHFIEATKKSQQDAQKAKKVF